MNPALEALETIKYECGFAFGQTGNGDRVRKSLSIIEKALKDYSEIKEIAEHYHFDDLAKDTHMTTTDDKYRLLFNAAIPDIQENYRKAKAFDIIKKNCLFYLHDDMPQGTYRIYDCELYSYYDIAKEDYYLLKEML